MSRLITVVRDKLNPFKTSDFNSQSQTIGSIIRGYKSPVPKQFGLLGFKNKLWQYYYYEHIIKNKQTYQSISDDMINNPLKWGNDKIFSK